MSDELLVEVLSTVRETNAVVGELRVSQATLAERVEGLCSAIEERPREDTVRVMIEERIAVAAPHNGGRRRVLVAIGGFLGALTAAVLAYFVG